MNFPFIKTSAAIVSASSLALVSIYAPMVQAATFSINANDPQYSNVPAAQGIGVGDIAELRIAGMTALVGRANSLGKGIKTGDIVTFKWQDGSSEKGQVNSTLSTVGTTPIPGTQQTASSDSGSGGGGDLTGGNYYSGGSSSGNNFSNCFSTPRMGTIIIGEGENREVHTFVAGTNLECPGLN